MHAWRMDLEQSIGRRPAWYHGWVCPLVYPGVTAIACYRIARFFYVRRVRWMSSLFKRLGWRLTGAEISPAADLAGGLRLPHPLGVVVGPGVRTEGTCTIFQSVTLGARRADAWDSDSPTLGDQTYIYGGARVLGAIRIGERSQIGPNCVVFKSLPDGSTVLPPEPRTFEGLSFSLRKPADPQNAPTAETAPSDERAPA